MQPQQQLLNNPISDLKNSPSSKENKDSVLSFNRFTVAQANHPVSIRASYGPFSTKQTVPARYIVPEDTENLGFQTKVRNSECVNFPFFGMCKHRYQPNTLRTNGIMVFFLRLISRFRAMAKLIMI